jgi:hypothetical protein
MVLSNILSPDLSCTLLQQRNGKAGRSNEQHQQQPYEQHQQQPFTPNKMHSRSVNPFVRDKARRGCPSEVTIFSTPCLELKVSKARSCPPYPPPLNNSKPVRYGTGYLFPHFVGRIVRSQKARGRRIKGTVAPA